MPSIVTRLETLHAQFTREHANLPNFDQHQLPAKVLAVITRMRERIEQQACEIAAGQVEAQGQMQEIERREKEIAWRDARLEKLTSSWRA